MNRDYRASGRIIPQLPLGEPFKNPGLTYVLSQLFGFQPTFNMCLEADFLRPASYQAWPVGPPQCPALDVLSSYMQLPTQRLWGRRQQSGGCGVSACREGYAKSMGLGGNPKIGVERKRGWGV